MFVRHLGKQEMYFKYLGGAKCYSQYLFALCNSLLYRLKPVIKTMLFFSTEKKILSPSANTTALPHLASEAENHYPHFSPGKTETQRD